MEQEPRACTAPPTGGILGTDGRPFSSHTFGTPAHRHHLESRQVNYGFACGYPSGGETSDGEIGIFLRVSESQLTQVVSTHP